MSGAVIFSQGFTEKTNTFVWDKHVFYRDTGATATPQSDGIPVVQQRDLRYGDQCGTAIDESPGLIKDGDAQDVPLRMVNTTIKTQTPRSFLDQNPTIDAFCFHVARG